MLAPPWKLALIIGAWSVSKCISKSSELARPSRLALIIGAWFLLQGISKSSELAVVGPAFEVGFDY